MVATADAIAAEAAGHPRADADPTGPDTPDDRNPAARLLERALREGPVARLPDGVIGIFDPNIALKVDKHNAEGLKVAESLVDVLGLRRTPNPVAWREVRALIAERSAQLSAPEHLRPLYARMRADLAAHAGREENLTQVVWQMMSRSLIPMVVANLDPDGARALAAEQEMRFRVQQKQRFTLRERVTDFLTLRASTRAIVRELKRRLRTGDAREDYAQSLLGLKDRIGLDRVTYLTTVQLIAISGVPGMMAACLMFAFLRYPQWHVRVREECRALSEDELYALPVRRMPCTMRVLKEAMRLWTTPFVTRRLAMHDIEFDEVRVKKGETYELSAYIQHHSPEIWDNPEAFDPDRWLPERRQAVSNAYVPFGFGPRSCVGASVGHAQLLLFCALLARDFDFSISPGHRPYMRMDDGFAVPADLTGTLIALS